MPSPKNMNANRFGGAVRAGRSPATAVSDSSQGRATVAPRPFKTTRRDMCCVLIEAPQVTKGLRLELYDGSGLSYTAFDGGIRSLGAGLLRASWRGRRGGVDDLNHAIVIIIDRHAAWRHEDALA